LKVNIARALDFWLCSMMRYLVAAAAFALGAPPATAPPASRVAGTYEVRQMEMAGGLELRADGRFRYAFTYGAVDESAEGDWTFDGAAVHLTSRPMPKEPTFTLVRDAPAPKCTLSISVDWGKFGWNSAPDLLVAYSGSPKDLHLLQPDERGRVHLDNCAVTTVLPLVPMFNTAGEPLNLSPAAGHKLSLRFVPNDLGHVAFRGDPLKLDGSTLVWERFDAEIRFLRVRP
jgi:hypothetical protein